MFSAQNLDMTRIIGGIVATPHSWPASAIVIFNYSALIRSQNSEPYIVYYMASCGGTLIDRHTVLTAGHVLFNFKLKTQ